MSVKTTGVVAGDDNGVAIDAPIHIERRNAFECMRNVAAHRFEAEIGHAWKPRAGSLIRRNGSTQMPTAAVTDGCDFIVAKRRAEIEPLTPAGTKIAFAGGPDCNDVAAIWAALDRIRAKHSDMVLLHGGALRGAEEIAAPWANNRNVAQIVFKPGSTRHAKAAPFKRNDELLSALPIGLVVFLGSGVTDNLADKAGRLGIPLLDRRR